MSTLTANAVLLPEHCAHKLPSSCRLTATPSCCACQDKRQHTPNYQKYIDGVGFVPWGTRQDRYCWPCREFWNARVHISGMRQTDTAIPDRPNISEFLTAWYDWQRGYRVIKHEDGREERQAMVGEPLSETGPGYLPRSAQELRDGLQPGEKEIEARGGVVEQAPQAPARAQIEDDFDSLFDSSDEEPDPIAERRAQAAAEHGHLAELAGDQPLAALVPSHLPDVQPERNAQPARRSLQDRDEAVSGQPLRISHEHYQRVTVLRRELQRMRQGIERVMAGLQSLDVDVPDSDQALEQINRLNGRLSRYREAPLVMPEVNNPDYQSPISNMFERAWQRHNQVQSDRLHALAIQNRDSTMDGTARNPDQPLQQDEQILAEIIRNARSSRTRESARQPGPGRSASSNNVHEAAEASAEVMQDFAQAGDRLVSLVTQMNAPGMMVAGARRIGNGDRNRDRDDDGEDDDRVNFLGLDEPSRPPAIEDDEAFKIDSRCDVCLQQVANVATFPCGHMIMCSWCADEVVPRHRSGRNIPRDSWAKCPQCRRKIKYIYTVRVRTMKEEATVRHQET